MEKLGGKKEFLGKQLSKVSKEKVRIISHKRNLKKSLKKIEEHKSKENQIKREGMKENIAEKKKIPKKLKSEKE